MAAGTTQDPVSLSPEVSAGNHKLARFRLRAGLPDPPVTVPGRDLSVRPPAEGCSHLKGLKREALDPGEVAPGAARWPI